MKPHITILVASMLFGCATVSDRDLVMDSWLNKPEDSLISKWGAPDSGMKLDNGKKVVTWIKTGTYSEGNNLNTYTCRRSFTVANSKVESWSVNGDCDNLSAPTSVFCLTDKCRKHQLMAD